MRTLILFAGLLILLATSMTCQKKACMVIEELPPPNYDTVTTHKTDRNDVPSLPIEPWWTLDTTNLDACQSRLWGYLKRMYPNREEDYWNYEIYSIMDEPLDLKQNRAFVYQFTEFFVDTIYAGLMQDPSLPCMSVDSSFFVQALGPPTCRSYNKVTKQTNYFYSFKLRYRHGPCPNIFDRGSNYEYSCHPQHFRYCGLMKMSFLNSTGQLIYIDFFGS